MSATLAIPETSRSRYLSGMAALNLPSPKGTGDWHLVETFLQPRQQRSRTFLAGVGCEIDTTPYLADLGVYECSAIMDELQIPHPQGAVYAASHARAIADLVLAAVLSDGSPDFVQLDDWMPRDNDKIEVFDLISIALAKLNAEQQHKVQAWQRKNSI